jgi:hypothetical protein
MLRGLLFAALFVACGLFVGVLALMAHPDFDKLSLSDFEQILKRALPFIAIVFGTAGFLYGWCGGASLAIRRAVRFGVWGAAAGAIIATAITIPLAAEANVPSHVPNRLTEEQILTIGRWVGVPIGAAVGGLAGFALSRRRSAQSPPEK